VLNAPGAALLHFLGGGIVLLAGASQFHKGWRTRYPHLHRWLGRVYVGGVLIGGIAGLYLAFYAAGGLAARFGFGQLAVLWLLSTSLAFWHILRRNIVVHQQWMTRSYAMTLGAVTLRIWLPLFLAMGIPLIRPTRRLPGLPGCLIWLLQNGSFCDGVHNTLTYWDNINVHH